MTIYDIAELAGVSIATVSRVVNGSPMVSERTKAKVLAVMEEHHYTPNVFAQALCHNSMRTVGLVCPDISDAYMAKAVACLESNLREQGYDCILYCSGHTPQGRQEAVRSILDRRIDALVVIGSVYSQRTKDGDDADYLRQAAEKVPVFPMNAYVQHENIYCTLCDDTDAAHRAVGELIASGRRRILFLSDSHSLSANLKLQGYRSALHEAGLALEDDLVVYAPNRIADVRDQLLKQAPGFDAVFATDDGLAVGALKYAKTRGLSVPGDLAVIGYNNFEISVACEPELTTVDSSVEQLCRQITDHMMQLFRSEPIPHTVYVKGQLVRRATTPPR